MENVCFQRIRAVISAVFCIFTGAWSGRLDLYGNLLWRVETAHIRRSAE